MKVKELLSLGRMLEKKVGNLSNEQINKVRSIIGKKSYHEIFIASRGTKVLNQLIYIFRIWNIENMLATKSSLENNYILEGDISKYIIRNTISGDFKIIDSLRDIEENFDMILLSIRDRSVIIKTDITADKENFRLGRKHVLEGEAAINFLRHIDLSSQSRHCMRVYVTVKSLENIQIGISPEGRAADEIKKWHIKTFKELHRCMYLTGTITEFLKDQDVFKEYRNTLTEKTETVGKILEDVKNDNSIYRLYARPTCYGRVVKYSVRVMISASNIAGLYNEQ